MPTPGRAGCRRLVAGVGKGLWTDKMGFLGTAHGGKSSAWDTGQGGSLRDTGEAQVQEVPSGVGRHRNQGQPSLGVTAKDSNPTAAAHQQSDFGQGTKRVRASVPTRVSEDGDSVPPWGCCES